MILVNWTYTLEEWKAFRKASNRTRTYFYRLRSRLLGYVLKSAPQISISVDKVWIGGEQLYFNSSRHELHQIDLRNEGTVNVLAITYEKGGGKHEIKVPVPKGKLKEAIEVQDRLSLQSLERGPLL